MPQNANAQASELLHTPTHNNYTHKWSQVYTFKKKKEIIMNEISFAAIKF